MTKKPYQTLNKRLLYENPWYQLRQDDVVLPNGEQTVYNVINKGDAAWIVPVLADGRVVLINQYRYAIDEWCLEIPAGGIYGDLSPEQTAHQELREEIGGTAGSLSFLGKFWTMNGIGNELGHFYMAQDVALSGALEHEATEVIELKIVDAQEAIAMARSGQIGDAPSALAILLCESRL
jgi:8-oxo-dGTP pyrophosphatase MutT (NUDIX family)